MPSTTKRHIIPGSERSAMTGAKAVGAVAADERFEVTLRLRAKAPSRGVVDGGAHADKLPGQRAYLSREDFAKEHGADAQDIAQTAAFAQQHQLVVLEASAARRSVVLSGTAATLSAAFGAKLQQFEHDNGTYRGRTGAISVPADLADLVEGVFGLDDRPQAAPHFQRLHAEGEVASRAAGASFTPTQLASLYQFPTGSRITWARCAWAASATLQNRRSLAPTPSGLQRPSSSRTGSLTRVSAKRLPRALSRVSSSSRHSTAKRRITNHMSLSTSTDAIDG